jgi:hypothetical protein
MEAPLSTKLAAYGESLSLGTEGEKDADEVLEVQVGGLVPLFLRGRSLLGTGVTFRGLAMLGCWIRPGRRTLQGQGFIGRGGLHLHVP